ncbi:hypothetical protein BGAL_0020g00330 [Botrytis galanthina]|uniref:Uncharacterized protein n=1 Tax=Botrytis galanthina TaxID=278940 RepID=A0A4S8RJ76_9HELO|nr:hypothetical protein BGAL_0020g00330 [Botrytis galanthina]
MYQTQNEAERLFYRRKAHLLDSQHTLFNELITPTTYDMEFLGLTDKEYSTKDNSDHRVRAFYHPRDPPESSQELLRARSACVQTTAMRRYSRDNTTEDTADIWTRFTAMDSPEKSRQDFGVPSSILSTLDPRMRDVIIFDRYSKTADDYKPRLCQRAPIEQAKESYWITLPNQHPVPYQSQFNVIIDKTPPQLRLTKRKLVKYIFDMADKHIIEKYYSRGSDVVLYRTELLVWENIFGNLDDKNPFPGEDPEENSDSEPFRMAPGYIMRIYQSQLEILVNLVRFRGYMGKDGGIPYSEKLLHLKYKQCYDRVERSKILSSTPDFFQYSVEKVFSAQIGKPTLPLVIPSLHAN